MTRSLSTEPARRYYDSLARRYERYIAPIVMPLIVDMVANLAAPLGSIALDIGTGNGSLPRSFQDRGLNAIGIDLSAEMLQAARRSGVSGTVVQADLAQSPFAPDSFDLIVSSFALNLSDPRSAFRHVFRLLKPGGYLVGQEWAVQDALSAAFDDAIADLDILQIDPRADLYSLADRWTDNMQDIADYVDRLTAAGFSQAHVTEQPLSQLPRVLADFVAYRLAWLIEPTPDLVAQIANRLAPFADSEGMIVWSPSVFRFRAQKPT